VNKSQGKEAFSLQKAIFGSSFFHFSKIQTQLSAEFGYIAIGIAIKTIA
jgi:hypothetical protein